MVRSRKRPSPWLVHRQPRRSRTGLSKGRLDASELAIVRHTLASLAEDGIIPGEGIDELMEHTAAAVSSRMLASAPKPPPVELPPSPPSPPTVPDRIAYLDASREAQHWVKIWGSARGAYSAASSERGRGRKPEWLRILAALADKEEREEVGRLPARKYKFASISRKPAVPINQSVKDGYIVCLVDGSKRTFLTRYLLAKFGMTPQDYRIHFGLPSDYPMTASNYRALKSQQAHDQGLGLPPGKARK